MKRLCTMIGLLFAWCSLSVAQPLPVTAVQIGRHIDITAGDKYITSYRFQDDEKYPFFYPVNGPVSGSSLTAMRNSLYPHQASMYLACDKLNGANYWQEGLERGQIHALGARLVPADEYHVVIEDECLWKRPGHAASVRDMRRITISAPSKEVYQIDFDVTIEMLEDVLIEKTIHSLFCVRVAEDLSVKQGGRVINSLSGEGIDGCFSVKAPWLDYAGERRTGREGIAILQHPSSAWFPAPWFVRDYGLFSASVINWPENGKNTTFRKGDRLTFRYRVLVHGGDAAEADIAGRYAAYTNE